MDMKHGKTTARRLLSVLLALVMCLGMLPVTASADDGKDTAGLAAEAAADPAGRTFRMSVLRARQATGDPSYDVSLEWIGDSRYCTLSDDKTHAEWNFTGEPDRSFLKSDMGHMFDFRLNIRFHDTDPSEFELKVPVVYYSKQYESDDWGVSKGDQIRYAIDEASFVQALADVPQISVISPSGADKNSVDRYYTLRVAEKASQNVSVPVSIMAYKLRGISNSSFDDYGFLELTDGDKFSITVTDGNASEYGLTANIHKGLYDMSVQPAPSYKSENSWTGYKKSRVYEWTSKLGEFYGLSKEGFDEISSSGYGLFAYNYKVLPEGWCPGRLELEAIPSGTGEVVSMKLSGTPYSKGDTDIQKLGESWYSYDGPDKIVFDFLEIMYYQSKSGIMTTYGTRSAMKGMMIGSVINWDHWSHTRSGVHVNVLVKYPLSEIRPDGSDTTVCSCDLNAKLTAGNDLTGISRSATQQVVEPYVNAYSSGSTYGISFDYHAHTSERSSALLLLDSGASEVQLGYAHVTGMASQVVGGEAVFSTGFVGLLAFDPLLREWVELEKDDYRFSGVSVSGNVGKVIYDTDGVIAGFDDSMISEDMLEHVLSIEAITSDAPGEWQAIGNTTYGSLQTAVELSRNDILCIRVVDKERAAPVSIQTEISYYLRSSERIKTLIGHMRDAGQTKLECRLVGFTSATSDTGRCLANMESVSGDFYNSISQTFTKFLGGEGYTDDVPLFASRSVSIYLDTYMNDMILVPTVYDMNGTAMGSYCMQPLSSNVSFVDWFVGTHIGLESWPGGCSWEFDENSVFRAEDAEFRILIPDGMDVAGVYPGFCDAMGEVRSVEQRFGSREIGGSPSPHSLTTFREAVDSVSIDHEVEPDYRGTGHTVLTVRAHTPYDKRYDASFKGTVFGGFTVRLQPKFTGMVTSSKDLRLAAASHIILADGTVFEDHTAGYSATNQTKVDDGRYFTESDVFSDLDDDGDTSEYNAIRHSVQCEILYQPLVSGIWLSAGKDGTNMWGREATVGLDDTYTYRLVYNQMSDHSRNVVLFDSIEDVDGGRHHGTLTGIDTSDADRQGLAYTVYVTGSAISSEEYASAQVTEKDLTGGIDGWKVYADGMDLSGVKAVAVGFGEQVFAKDEEGTPSTVTVRLRMKPDVTGLEYGSNIARNRAFFSDVLFGTGSSGTPRSVLSNITSVDLDTTVSVSARKKVGIDGSELASSATVTEEGQAYSYRLSYATSEGKTTGVVLYDHIENGSISRFAGTVTGVDLTGCGDIPVQVWVQGLGPGTDVPEALGELPGDWKRIDPDAFTDWAKVTHAAFYFGGHVFSDGQGVYADILMRSGLDTKNKPTGAIDESLDRTVPNDMKAVFSVPNIAGHHTEDVTGTEIDVTYDAPEPLIVDPSVEVQVWTDPDSAPSGPDDDPNWGTDCDAAIGGKLYYRMVIDFGTEAAYEGRYVFRPENMVLNCLVDRITPDYKTMKVWQAGNELEAGKDYRLYTDDFGIYADDFDLEHVADADRLIALRDKLQEMYCPYYTFGLAFSNELPPDTTDAVRGTLVEELGDMKRSRMRGLAQAVADAKPGPDRIVVTYEATADDSAFLTGGTGYRAEAAGMPFRSVSQDTTAVLGRSGMDAGEFEALIGKTGDDRLPRFAGTENLDVEEVERTGEIPSYNMHLDVDVPGSSSKMAEQQKTAQASENGATTYRVFREYYMYGNRFASTKSAPIAGKVGEKIVGAKIDKEKPSWRFYIIDGVRRQLAYAGSSPKVLTLTGDADEDTIVLRYEYGVYAPDVYSSSAASVHHYGFDIAKLDMDGKLLQGGTFEIRTGPEDDAGILEFVRVRLNGQDGWMDGSDADWSPEGPVYRLAVDSDPQGARVTEIEAGKAILVGLDSGMYYVVEKESPSGYQRDREVHSVKLLSWCDVLRFVESTGSSRRGLEQGWDNIVPIQVDGGGLYDLSLFDIEGKCVSAMALFDHDAVTDTYTYGNSRLVLQAGPTAGQSIQGTPENPVKGGLPVTNLPELELPKTGGTGIGAYIAIGSTMVLLSGLLLIDRKKRR